MEKNDILIINGTNYKEMAIRLLEEADLASLIKSRNMRIALKPNILGTILPEEGATTHTEPVCGVIEYLQGKGFKNISIMEGAWVGDNTQSAFEALGYNEISKKYGIPLIDLQKDEGVRLDAKGMYISICKKALEMDFVINMPVVKGHCQTVITCALKNNKGVIPNSEKRRFHTLGLHKPIAHLNTVARNDFILADNICGDLDFEEGGNPVHMDRLLAFRDPVLCDCFVCSCLGFKPEEVKYIGMAEKLGVGSSDLGSANIIYLNEAADCGAACSFRPSGRVRSLGAYACPDNACSACYGQLIYALNRLNDAGKLRFASERPKIAIGQGYRGKEGEIGIGSCTACFGKSLKGCPPKAVDILNFLENEWK